MIVCLYLAAGTGRTAYQITLKQRLVERAAVHVQRDMQYLSKSATSVIVRWSFDTSKRDLNMLCDLEFRMATGISFHILLVDSRK